jgi:hypothetical protein
MLKDGLNEVGRWQGEARTWTSSAELFDAFCPRRLF